MVLKSENINTFRAVFSPDGTRVATADYDTHVRVWDTNGGKILLSFDMRPLEPDSFYNGWLYDVVFSPDGKLLATSSVGDNSKYGTVRIWDAKTGKILFGVNDLNNTTGTFGLAFSPDGKQLAVAYGDNTARVWDISSLKSQTQPLLTLRGHSNLVYRVTFNPDGTKLATASFDGTVKLWDVSPGPEQGREIATLTGHRAEVSQVAFSPDGKYIASASFDGTVRIYYTQIEDLITAAKERVTRSLTTEECQKYLHVDVCPAPP
jgi:WD40 repeat protein